jgi:hypothetical protein
MRTRCRPPNTPFHPTASLTSVAPTAPGERQRSAAHNLVAVSGDAGAGRGHDASRREVEP